MKYTNKKNLEALSDAFKSTAQSCSYYAAEGRARSARNISAKGYAGSGLFRATLDKQAKEEIQAEKSKLRTSVSSALDGVIDELKAYTTIPASDEAISLLGTMQMRTGVSQNEVDAAMDKYGSNYQFASALGEIARSKKLSCNAPDIERAISRLEVSKNGLLRTISNMGDGQHSDGYYTAVARETVSTALEVVEGVEGNE